MNSIHAASVQFNHAPGDKAANLAIIRHFSQQAAADHADLVVFPEMCVTGYWHVRKLSRRVIAALAEPVPGGPTTRALLGLAEQHRLSIGAGLIELADDGRLYNTYVVAMPDGRVASHRKLHCFISEHMASGDDFTVFDLPDGTRAGILICYDNNIVENVRATALLGAQVLLAPHQTGGCITPSPRCMGGIELELWRRREEDPAAIEAAFRGHNGREWLMHWLPARAHDNGIFVIFSNGVGIDDDEVRTGNAMIIDGYGDILAETWKARDDMVTADLDLDMLPSTTGQRWIRSRRPELYDLLTRPTGRELDIRTVRFTPATDDGDPRPPTPEA